MSTQRKWSALLVTLALTLILCLLASTISHARGGGHVTKFDANIFGGPANVSCLVGGSVAGMCNTGYSATCNGIASDQTALTNWRNAVKGSSALAVLYIAPGSNCVFTAGDFLIWDGSVGGTNYVPNSVVWAYGATANLTKLGGSGIPLASGSVANGCAWSARINTVSAGASTVVLSTGNMVDGSSATGVFAAGTPVLVAGIELQNAGYPPNFQRFEYSTVTSVAGNNITLASPLINSYESTWPIGNQCVTSDGAGAATIYKLLPSFNVNFAIYGLTNIQNGGLAFAISGANVRLYDVVFYAGFPTDSQNWWSFYSNFPGGIPGGMEVDKEVQTMNFVRSYADSVNIQSASIQQINIVSSTIAIQTIGTPNNLLSINSDLGPTVHLGPIFGIGGSITLDGTKIVNVTNAPNSDLLSVYSYSSGVFSVPLSSLTQNISVFVPGGTYALVYYPGGPSFVFCSPAYVFKVSDISTSGGNFLATTGTWTQDGSGIATPAALPSLTNACSGNTANRAATYSAQTIKQINSLAGSSNITGYVAPY